MDDNWHLFFYIFLGMFVATYLSWYIRVFNQKEWEDYISNIHVELAGVFFDIILFGILFYIFQFIFQKKEKIIQLSEQLDDYRDWDEREAGYRVIGILKRLQKLGIDDVNLSRCHFNGINIISDEGRIVGFDFKRSDITDVTFTNIMLNSANFNKVQGNSVADYADFFNDPRTIFKNCDLRSSNFSNNTFYSFDFSETKLENANFIYAEFYYAQFRKCIFNDVKFNNVVFTNSFFQDIDLSIASYVNTKFYKCNFINCKCPDDSEMIVFEECKHTTDILYIG